VHLHMLQQSLRDFADWGECGGIVCLSRDRLFGCHHLPEQLVHLAALCFEGLRRSRAGGLAPPLGTLLPLREIVPRSRVPDIALARALEADEPPSTGRGSDFLRDTDGFVSSHRATLGVYILSFTDTKSIGHPLSTCN
jgi:hypothetical protein